ncbi:hypothetical protein HDU87_003552 [Geranomyces variabilis]|uniref:Uncharacterized protein n=1 Tax=Geranomyces variabilis TaxID=109894 RepID=A0AAD5TJK9_9FUNG|nr:hypothetical protein HDU87_003552 [Geranomyces variabilis]
MHRQEKRASKENGPPPHILKPSPAKAAAALSKLDDTHEPQSLADWNAASENVLNDTNATAAAPPDPPAQAAPVSKSSPPQKRPIILEIVNGTDRRSKKAATSNSEPAYTAPFPHPSEPGKIVLRNPWDGDTVVLDREEEERAAREFFRAHVAETEAGLHGSSRGLSGADGQKGEEEEEKRASVAAELVPTVAGVESEQGGFAMGALLPPLVHFMTVSDSEGSASPGPPAHPPPQQQQQAESSQQPSSSQPQKQQQQQQQQRTSFEAEMLAIFESVRSSVTPSNSAMLASLASTSTQQQPLLRDQLPPPPSTTPGGKVFTPAIPPPNRSPPKPPTAAVQSPPRQQQQQQQPQQPQRPAQNRPSMETARSSLDKIQLAALGLAADLDASEGDSGGGAPAAPGATATSANPTAAATRAPAGAAAVASPKGVITPTVLSAKRVQVTPANRLGPPGGGGAASSSASAYTTTSGPAGGGGEPPRMAREQSAGDGAAAQPSSGVGSALPLPDTQKQKGVSS